jgi:FkbM family methyltransferase
LDLGANIGFYSLESAIAVGSAGRVIAVEAAPSHANSLRKNVEINDLKNVHVIEKGVWRSSGEAKLGRNRSENLGMYSLGSVDSSESYSVALTTIDELLDECHVPSLDLMKVDIEGSEVAALEGAKKVLAHHRPAILIEINDSALRRCGSSKEELFELLRGYGYRGWSLGRAAAEPLRHLQTRQDCVECLFLDKSKRCLITKLGLPD